MGEDILATANALLRPDGMVVVRFEPLDDKAVEAAALKWCEQDKIDPDAMSLGKDMKTRTALENRKLELLPILQAYLEASVGGEHGKG